MKVEETLDENDHQLLIIKFSGQNSHHDSVCNAKSTFTNSN